MSTPLLLAENISVRRGERFILKGINLSLHQGDCVGLLGANGAGKTTLIEVLAGLISPTEGKVECSTSRSITSSSSFLYKSLTIKENLSIIGGTPNQQLMELLGLAPLLNEKVGTLSRGELSKLSFIRALMSSPKVLLLDELSAPLDDSSLSVIIPELKKFTATGAVIFATHDEKRLAGLFSRVISLSGGAIESNRSFVPEVV